jgi:hypothetical protein
MKVVSPSHRPPLPHRNIPGTHFCWRMSRYQGHSAAGSITSILMTPSGIEPATSSCIAPTAPIYTHPPAASHRLPLSTHTLQLYRTACPYLHTPSSCIAPPAPIYTHPPAVSHRLPLSTHTIPLTHTLISTKISHIKLI